MWNTAPLGRRLYCEVRERTFEWVFKVMTVGID